MPVNIKKEKKPRTIAPKNLLINKYPELALQWDKKI